MAFDATRRRFLFSIGATGALLATPLPLIELAEAAVPVSTPPLSRLSGSAVLDLVGKITFGNHPVAGAVEITQAQFLSMVTERPQINLTPTSSDSTEFIPGAAANELVLEGFIDKSLQDALMDGKVFPLSVKMPGRNEWLSSTAFVRSISRDDLSRANQKTEDPE